jgi:hypothetical protein
LACIDKVGNLGIGTGSSSLTNSVTLQKGDAGNNVVEQFSNTAGTPKGYIGVIGSNGNYVSSGVSNDFFIRSQGNLLFACDSNGTERMRITSGGYVGINTGSTTVRSLLDVRSSNSTPPTLSIGSTTSTFVANTDEAYIDFGTYFTPLSTWYPCGRITGFNENSSDSSFGGLSFSTRKSGVMTEAARFTNTGLLKLRGNMELDDTSGNSKFQIAYNSTDNCIDFIYMG